MKTNFLTLSLVMLAVASTVLFSGCKKDNDEITETDTKSLQQLSKDETAVQNAYDEVFGDINNVLSGNNNKNIAWLPCNVTVDSSSVVNDTITYSITFNGLNCPGTRFRKGNALVKKHVNTHWHQAGATVYVTFINLKITRVSTGNWLILNGAKMFVNVSGGRLVNLGTTISSVVHRISGVLHATFIDNTTRVWNIARQRTFTGSPGSLIVSNEGFGSTGTYSNLVAWGVNRHGEDFYTSIPQPVVISQVCGWDLQAGQKVHEIPGTAKKATLTFGFDANLQPVAVGNCATHYKLDWENNGNTGSLYLQLP